jgi:L-lysine exporter family protein LysE/ArgO
MEPLIHGIILAFGLILPLGVQNVFIFNQGATQPNFIKSAPAVIVASICDTLLIILAVAGVSVVVLSYEGLRIILFMVGFLFLLYMGWVLWKSAPSIHSNVEGLSVGKQISFAASVSLLNPHAILDTIGVIGTSSLVYEGLEKIVFSVACIAVSWLWFFCLAILGRKVGQITKSGNFLKKLNQLSAIIVWGMSLFMAYQIIENFSR